MFVSAAGTLESICSGGMVQRKRVLWTPVVGFVSVASALTTKPKFMILYRLADTAAAPLPVGKEVWIIGCEVKTRSTSLIDELATAEISFVLQSICEMSHVNQYILFTSVIMVH